MAKTKDVPVADDLSTVELTEAETRVALSMALNQKIAQMRADVEAQALAVAEASARDDAERQARAEADGRHDRPYAYIGIILDDGSRQYFPNASDKHDRTVQIGLTTYEHRTEDADGVWLYAYMR